MCFFPRPAPGTFHLDGSSADICLHPGLWNKAWVRTSVKKTRREEAFLFAPLSCPTLPARPGLGSHLSTLQRPASGSPGAGANLICVSLGGHRPRGRQSQEPLVSGELTLTLSFADEALEARAGEVRAQPWWSRDQIPGLLTSHQCSFCRRPDFSARQFENSPIPRPVGRQEE